MINDKNEIAQVNFCSDSSKMQTAVIHQFLSQSYWAKGISKSLVEQSLQNSLCFGGFVDGKQVAFARVITDKMSFAYLADVFVLEAYQGNGIAKQLMAFILQHSDLQTLRRFMLCTADAHGLYKQFGFTTIKSPMSFMSIHQPGLYQQ